MLARMAAVGHRHDRPRALRQRGVDRVAGSSHGSVTLDDVGEHRRGAGVRDGVDGRHEGHRRHDDLVARPEARRGADQVQAGRAVGDGERVARADVGGELALERLGLRAHAEPARAVDVGDDGDVVLGHDDVGERDRPPRHAATVLPRVGGTVVECFCAMRPSQAGRPRHRRGRIHRRPPRRAARARGRARARALPLQLAQRPRNARLARRPRSTAEVEVVLGELRDVESVAAAVAGHRGRAPPRRADRDPVLVRQPARLRRGQRAGHAERRPGGAAPRRAARRAHVDERGLRHRPDRPDHRGPSARAAVAVRREQGRRRQADGQLPPLVRPAGDRAAAVQHLRPAPVGARDHPHDHRPGAGRARRSASGRCTRSATSPSSRTRSRASSPRRPATRRSDARSSSAPNHDVSVGELVEMVGELLGRELAVETDPDARAAAQQRGPAPAREPCPRARAARLGAARRSARRPRAHDRVDRSATPGATGVGDYVI